MGKITRKRLKEVLSYDPDTGVFRWLVRTSNRVNVGDEAGCVSKTTGYRYICIDGIHYRAHGLAWFYMIGKWPAEVDHRDTIRTNNKWKNLRKATSQQNSMNTKKHRDNKSGYKGVHWNEPLKKWRAQITVESKRIHLGVFEELSAAAAVYKAASEFYFGSFSRCA